MYQLIEDALPAIVATGYSCPGVQFKFRFSAWSDDHYLGTGHHLYEYFLAANDEINLAVL